MSGRGITTDCRKMNSWSAPCWTLEEMGHWISHLRALETWGHSREVAWTVQLSTISLQRGELFREFKNCAVLRSIQGLIWVRSGHQVLNTYLILSMWTMALTMWLAYIEALTMWKPTWLDSHSSPACSVLPAEQADRRGTVHHQHCYALISAISNYGLAGVGTVHQLCLPVCTHSSLQKCYCNKRPMQWFCSK